ncbi:hypothetical protein [Parvularcula lutaonensis]|uniref:Tellurium resistance protein TerC n=1 Tax=Parvularcula lutaonensis TaxID=491923 RepID=A0ABV7MB84_9PROT|nr:hypothetical protein [Parvularcula lutaonensis]GGY43699.1 hypothetical protein GCM10007148_10600 [Parvularcula lutaonensis]
MSFGEKIRRVATLVGGGVLVLFGVLLAISPLPMGILLVAIGMGLLVMGSPRIAAWLRFNRTYNDTLDKQAAIATKHAPKKIAEALEKTDPRRRYD